ncbi:hypothetical protein C1I98_30600 [Spongiactinospora gelatinilytica]|uniref:Secreted protein n=1 Tax=Spongiactinospora gelatinilytica TaxID=2666298 RepID=A0A2W2F6G2_9ACTN|nr:hypothetical protein [Spongiactinospora gelatinilytica]PZG30993.1 hypothetical protein C1I98_30600 [Spongiactinospora gelatinilytica]
MNIRKRIAALSATLLAIAALFVTATPAYAAPTDCRTGKDHQTENSGIIRHICTGGDGGYLFTYRVKHPDPRRNEWLYGYQTSCVPVPQWLEFHYVLGAREITGVVYC